MKRAFIILICIFVLSGCASTLSMKGADGSIMTLSNYAVTEVYADGKLVQRVMVPDNSWFAGIIEKVTNLWNSVVGMGVL
jgi:hypothetical protein